MSVFPLSSLLKREYPPIFYEFGEKGNNEKTKEFIFIKQTLYIGYGGIL
jgi:hypothetical protein